MSSFRAMSKRTKIIMASLVKPIAIISLCLGSLAPAYAEERQSKDMVLRIGGFLGGGGVDWVGKDANGSRPDIEQVARPGFYAGLMVPLDLSRLLALDIEPFHLAVQPELVYATKGSRLEREGEYRGASTNLAYLQAGLLIKAEYATRGRAAPYLVLGPELGFLLSAKFENGLGDTIDISDNLDSTDLGLILGVGALYALPPWGALGLELRADLGLVSIDGQGDGDEIRNAALTLLLVYLY
jgi:opacity protein-like surface antigen